MNPESISASNDLSLLARQWGAHTVPFGLVNDTDWLDTPPVDAALKALSQTAALRSVMLLSGPNGVGKSALAGRWLARLDSRLYAPLSLTQSTLSGSGILSTLATQLGQPVSFRRERNLALIQEAFLQLEQRIPVLVLDEAQNLSHSSLEEIRLLLGLNLAQHPTFALILLGDEYLLGTLRLRHQRALYSRLARHSELPIWSPEQCVDYLRAGLQAVGLTQSAIEPAAEELLAKASGGIARSLCLLARAAWIQAASQPTQQIRTQHVNTAMESVPCVPGLVPPQPEQS
jgi:type II secretory pathway predicted ATPase ExeA